MRRTRGSWVWIIALGTALGLVGAPVAPDVAQAGGVQFQSHPAQTWSGSHAPRQDFGRRGQGDHGGWRDGGWRGQDGWRGRDPHSDWGWRRGGHGGGWGYGRAPVHVPPRWVWNGYGWVLEPGYWR